MLIVRILVIDSMQVHVHITIYVFSQSLMPRLEFRMTDLLISYVRLRQFGIQGV